MECGQGWKVVEGEYPFYRQASYRVWHFYGRMAPEQIETMALSPDQLTGIGACTLL
jgi:hypothetical protein